jgi:hypothetical protein
MSQSSNEGHFENMILMVIAGGLGIAGILYVMYLFWPYVVFYVLPLVISSLAVGFVLRIAIAHMDTDGGQIEGEYESKTYRMIFQYKNLLMVYPGLILVTLLVFEVGSVQRVMVDKKGQEVGQYLEWPKAHKVFNEWRASIYVGSPFDSLKREAKTQKLYDRRQIGWIMWWALFFFGPLFCGWLSRHDEKIEGLGIYKQIEVRAKALKDSLMYQIMEQENIVQKKVSFYLEEVEKVKAENSALMAENQRLKAVVEFSSEVPKRLTDPNKKGVLDSDLL